jgi:hypothetical protein
MLGLRLDEGRASDAVDGWEGGIYRAWTDGRDVAVVLRTTWNDAGAASRFADAMNEWLTDGSRSAELLPSNGNDVTAVFASNDQTLQALRSAL